MMEFPKEGAGDPEHATGTPPRPIPPGVARKPKPSPPKKPAVAQKPRPDRENQNGSITSARFPTDNLAKKTASPAKSQSLDSSTQDDPSSTTPICQKRPSLSRPKDPPPPLPKQPPVCSSVPSPRGRAPPPLPNTPPKCTRSITPASNRARISPQSSIDTTSDIAATGRQNQHNIGSPVVTKATSSGSSSERNTPSPCARSNNPNVRRRPLPDTPRKPRVSPSRQGNSTHKSRKENKDGITAGSFAAEQLCSSTKSANVSKEEAELTPPVKPDRRHKHADGELASKESAIKTEVADNVHSKDVSTGCNVSSNGEMVSGRSTWYVEADDDGLDISNSDRKFEAIPHSLSLDSVPKSDSKLKSGKEESVDDFSIKMLHSSPQPMKKSSPRVPPKRFASSEFSNSVSSNGHNPNHSVSCDKQTVSDKAHLHSEHTKSVNSQDKSNNNSASTGRPIALSRTHTSTKTSESCDQTDLIVPRKPVPAVRPRPTPRKRLSLCQDAADDKGDETLSNSVSDLSSDTGNIKVAAAKSKSEENIFKSAKLKTPKDSPAATSRRVYSKKGEEKQYRFIDKSVVNRQMHTADTEGNVLKSDDIEITVDASPSVSELRNKFKYSKEAKSPPTAAERSVVPNKEICDHSKASLVRPNTLDVIEQDGGCAKQTDKNIKDSFEDLLSDKSLLEPSSLLTEIEAILTRSFKHCSLTRSGSSPEKTIARPSLLDFRHERSKSLVCSLENTPVRPPRPKKEQKRLRSLSQTVAEYYASDTESLPDMSNMSELSLLSDSSQTLGPAKPHPPKPKRHKLMKVQRSQSDVTAMKAFLNGKDQSESRKSPYKRQFSDAGVTRMEPDDEEDHLSAEPAADSSRPKSWRNKRPSRKAPAPPQVPPYMITPPSPGVDIDMVIPVDPMVKSIKLKGKDKKGNNLRNNSKSNNKSSIPSGSVGLKYDTLDNEEVPYSSDDNHDYHEIPDSIDTDSDQNDSPNSMVMPNIADTSYRNIKEKRSPPKLPPRSYMNSQSFETSSQSSVGADIDSLADGGSSMEDVSTGSSQRFRVYPKTSSPNVDHITTKSSESIGSASLGPDSLSLPDSTDGNWMVKQQAASDVSQSDASWHTAQLTSSESEGEAELKISRKQAKKLFLIAQEIASSEKVFVDILTLLNVDFRKHISDATERLGRPVIPTETLNRILDYLPQLQNFNEDLLKDLEDRIRRWDEQKGVADIFVKKGPFLKLYSSYIRDFETMTATLDDAIKKYPPFHSALKEFELSPRCASLALRHYMLKPIQRIPQYRMLLQDYAKHMPADAPDMKVMQTALTIVSEVAEHANENMRHEDYVKQMLEIQRSLVGQFEVIKPGRLFLKEGELMKLSRKEMQPRYFFLFNDVLLYTTPVVTGYRLNNILSLAGMKVSVSAQDEYRMEFNVVAVQRSFSLAGANLEERDDWISALKHAIEENVQKRNTFEAVRTGAQVLMDKDFVLGHKAPLWIPDARVTMCMLCTCEFTVTWRRHHCRACGRIVCGNCSDCKAQLRYLKYKMARVCDECFRTLEAAVAEKDGVEETVEKGDNPDEGMSLLSINGLFERFNKIRLSGRSDKKLAVNRPDRLKEVAANDEGASMSGYLQMLRKGRKWKKYWYVIKDKVLYTYKATQDRAAKASMALLGYEVTRLSEYFEGVEPALLFQLSHHNTEPILFRTDSATATERWVMVMRESTVA